MKSAAEILQEMGFKKDSSPETQKAFLKHLIAASGEKAKVDFSASAKAPEKGEQLSFNLTSNQVGLKVS